MKKINMRRAYDNLSEPVQVNPGECEDCGEQSRLRGKRPPGRWLCGFCYYEKERTENVNKGMEWEEHDLTPCQREVLRAVVKSDEPIKTEKVVRETSYAYSTVNAQMGELFMDGYLDRTPVKSDRQGPNPYVYTTNGELD